MHVRLGFAVAAHLEPDILIVDEVLAVGDAEFQKKCLGKMQDVSTNEGRTVLFVSHNMQAIANLTQRCVVLDQGGLCFDGATYEALPYYLKTGGVKQLSYKREPLGTKPSITEVFLNTSKPGNFQINGQPFEVEIEMFFPKSVTGVALSFQIYDFFDNAIVHCWVYQKDIQMGRKTGRVSVICSIPKFRLYMGNYYLNIHFSNTETLEKYEQISRICPFEMDMFGTERIHPFVADTCRYIEDVEWKLGYSKNE
jgi:lipopolysaccharide transport system ATP-binding protein